VVICWYRRTKLAIDWHNFGYTILALRLGKNHPFVKLSQVYERYFARYADVNFTVSEAMSQRIKRDFLVTAPVLRLYDRPTADFKPLGEALRIDFLKHIDLPAHQKGLLEKGKIKVLVSSTSWTTDEDFSILLDALVGYSKAATSTHPQLPELLVIITGKGPQKDHYLRKIVKLEKGDDLEMVTIKTAWLPTSEYAKLLASADLGVCLHQSSSGVDLPMKVVDMFGAGLPVVGWGRYESWPELVKDGVNGRDFGSTQELQDILMDLFGDDGTKLEHLRNGVMAESGHQWQDEWEAVVGKTLQHLG
jgi:beta-1,4-mannosyltransferase